MISAKSRGPAIDPGLYLLWSERNLPSAVVAVVVTVMAAGLGVGRNNRTSEYGKGYGSEQNAMETSWRRILFQPWGSLPKPTGLQ